MIKEPHPLTMIPINKKIIRSTLRKNLIDISSKRKLEASYLVNLFLKDVLQKSSCDVFSFASKPYEINLWPLLRWLCSEQRLLLPKINQDIIEVYRIPSLYTLRLSFQNIQEPNESFCHLINHLSPNTLVLVPGLGFDGQGNRIGHGKGHYDKFFATYPHLTKWGIGFKEQKCQSLPTEEHDILMNEVHLF